MTQQYIIYGKHSERWYNPDTKQWNEPDKTFKALDYKGIRVNNLSDAGFYDSKEEAQRVLDSSSLRNGAVFDIRKAK